MLLPARVVILVHRLATALVSLLKGILDVRRKVLLRWRGGSDVKVSRGLLLSKNEMK